MKRRRSGLTLLLVHTQHDHDLTPANTNELLNGANTPARQLAQQNHSLNVVVLLQVNIGTHVGDTPAQFTNKNQPTKQVGKETSRQTGSKRKNSKV